MATNWTEDFIHALNTFLLSPKWEERKRAKERMSEIVAEVRS